MFVVFIVAALAGVVLAAGQSGGRGRERVTYDRRAAAAYADAWALGNNPRYWSSPDNDCADFVSQCLAAGGLRPLDDPGREWHANGAEFPTIAWVNCGAQKRSLSSRAATHTRYIARSTSALPRAWAAGDVVYLGNTVDGKTEWQHVIICVGKKGGEWVYDSHTTAYLRAAARGVVPGALLADPLLPHRRRRELRRGRVTTGGEPIGSPPVASRSAS